MKQVYAIYGINVDTEISAIYKRAARRVVKDKLQSKYVLDKQSKALAAHVLDKNGYVFKKGLLFETSNSPQKDPLSGQPVKKSGDGTVPLKSLQAVYQWRTACNVKVKELDGVRHRDIVAHSDLHELILDHCIYGQVVEQKNIDLKAKYEGPAQDQSPKDKVTAL